MQPRFPAFLAALSLALCPAARAGELILVSEGTARLPIVVPREPAKHSAEADFAAAAADLQSLLRRLAGAAPELVTIEQWTPRGPAIFMGCRPPAAATEAALVNNEEGSRVRCCPEGLFFSVCPKASAATQNQAMRYAVNRFAERVLGCRWLMPGELGAVLPRRSTVALAEMTLVEDPPFWSRRLRDAQAEFGGKEARHQQILENLQRTSPVEGLKEAEQAMGAADWLARMNMGSRFSFVFGHNFGGWWEKYGPTHPEFFALQPDGTRTQHPPRERLCESQPKLWDQVAANVVAAFEADPGLRMFSICENDGSLRNKFCMCPECMALDPAGAPRQIDRKTYDPRSGEPFADGYPALSDRVFTFFNEVARRVKDKYPDRYLGTYAYSIYRSPPVGLSKVEDNLIVSLVSDDPGLLEAWSKIAAKLCIRPNALGDSKTFGMVRNDARRLGKFIQRSADYHVLGHDWAGLFGNWATQGLNYYVLAKMLWDPRQDVEAVIEDYLAAAYGRPALPAMRRYFDRLEALTDAIREDRDYGSVRVKSDPQPLLAHYTAERLDELQACLAQAREATAPDSAERRRVELVLLGLDYTRHVCGLMAGIRDSRDRKPYETEWRRQSPYFAQLAKNPYFGIARNLSRLTPALKKIGPSPPNGDGS